MPLMVQVAAVRMARAAMEEGSPERQAGGENDGEKIETLRSSF